MSVLSADPFSMDNASARPRHRARAVVALLMFSAAAVWGISLSRHLFAPYGNDHVNLQYFTERVMAGDRMYADLLEHNSPGIIAIHWLSTMLFGREPMGLRIFDACWQFMTFAAMILLAGRDGRRWAVGWLAVILYALAFYGYGHTNTAERDGFCVLLLMLAAHAMLRVEAGTTRFTSGFAGPLAAGVLGFVVFAIKPPLGMCFGALWLYALGVAWTRRGTPRAAVAPLAGLTTGFVISALLTVGLFVHLDWWSAYWPILSQQEFPEGYIVGPWQIRMLLPSLGIAAVLLAMTTILSASRHGRDARSPPPGSPNAQDVDDPAPWPQRMFGPAFAGILVAGFLLTLTGWPAWGRWSMSVIGLLIPALGAVAVRTWRDRSPAWRLGLLLGAAALASVFLQGRFTPYRFAPFLAFAALLAADELYTRFRSYPTASHGARTWAAVCLAGAAHLGLAHWWPSITMYSDKPYVLSGTTLHEHYARLIAASPNVAPYDDAVRAAERIRSLTEAHEPITVLFTEPRIYYLSRRPPAHRLILTRDFYRDEFPAYMRAIEERRPKVVVSRVPEAMSGEPDHAMLESAIFDDVEAHFGEYGRVIREHYRLTDVFGRVVLLQPRSILNAG